MPHSPVMSKIRCPHPNRKSTRVRNRNYLMYIATREGVDLTDTSLDQNLTEQALSIENLDDENMSTEAANNIYVKYIAERPRSHGLFGSSNVDVTDVKKLSNEMAELSKKGVNIYRGIVSLSGQDAIELGYDKKENWENLMHEAMPKIAEQFGIPIDKFAWTAAVHAEKGHPHVHYMFWRTDDAIRSNYIHVATQNKCREAFSGIVFKEELFKEIVNKRTAKDYLIEFGKSFVSDLKIENDMPGKIKNDMLYQLADKMQDLIRSLPQKGRINYQFVPPSVKAKVDDMTDLLLSHPDIKNEYTKYLNSVDAISKTYSASKKKAAYNLEDAKFDIKKRLGNIILSHAKNVRNELHEVDKPANSNRSQEYKEIQKEQLLISGCYQIFRSAFSSIFKANAVQQDTNEFRSKSKEAMRDLARKHGRNSQKESPE